MTVTESQVAEDGTKAKGPDQGVIDALTQKQPASPPPSTPTINLDSTIQHDGQTYKISDLIEAQKKAMTANELESFRKAARTMYDGTDDPEALRAATESFYKGLGLEGKALREAVEQTLPSDEPEEGGGKNKKKQKEEQAPPPKDESLSDVLSKEMVLERIEQMASEQVGKNEVIQKVIKARKEGGATADELAALTKTFENAAVAEINRYLNTKISNSKTFNRKWFAEAAPEAAKKIEHYARLHYGDPTKLGPSPTVTAGSVFAQEVNARKPVEFPKIGKDDIPVSKQKQLLSSAIKDRVERAMVRGTQTASV